MTTAVIVLNASYEPHQVVDLKHAIRMLCRRVAVVEETDEGRFVGPFPFPRVIRLIKYVYLKFNPHKGGPRYSRTGVLRRDNYSCAYCGKHALTIDHVVPRSKGGASTWLNSVAACRKCNERKADKSLKAAGMKLLFDPFVPTFFDLSK